MGSCLDVGAGTGLLTFELAPSFEQVTAFDVSAGMLEVLQAKADRSGVGVTTTLGPLEQLPKFDMIFSLLAFHHIPDADGMASRLLEHLKPGGRLLVCDLLATPNVRRFHKPHEIVGEHYEHDGFAKSAVQSWFSDCDDFDWVEMPLRKDLAEGWRGAGFAEAEEFHLFVASATLKA
mmetsp:Transcript_7410/g.18961  ORF Transcript_7410/g.18961 Transcript_7410/m.18961 type:complete len:177 (-) Transcript_7410:183-713(-)